MTFYLKIFWLTLLLTAAGQTLALKLGEVAPAFTGPYLLAVEQGTEPSSAAEFDSATLSGQVVYVDFWASWCGPCRVSLPALNNIYQEFSAQGFNVVAINLNRDKNDALEFLNERPVVYPVIYDVQGQLPEVFGVKGMPTAFLLDREGRVRHIHEGFRPGEEVKLRELIAQLIKEP